MKNEMRELFLEVLEKYETEAIAYIEDTYPHLETVYKARLEKEVEDYKSKFEELLNER